MCSTRFIYFPVVWDNIICTHYFTDMRASVQPCVLSLGSEVITISLLIAKVTLRRTQNEKRVRWSVISEIIWEGFNLVEPEGRGKDENA